MRFLLWLLMLARLVVRSIPDCWLLLYGLFLTFPSSGPLIGGFVFAATSWQWMQWITLMLGLAAFLFGIGMPETYAREIVRRRARRHGVQHKLLPAESGVMLRDMAQITFFTPLKMLVTEPLVILISLYLALNFAVLFQWFITVPIALPGAYGFDIQQVGLAFIAAIVGVILATATTTVLDHVMAPRAMKQDIETMNMTMNIEYRLYPAMIGCIFIPASLFWIGWTATPSFTRATPVIGTLFYVWGSALTLVSDSPIAGKASSWIRSGLNCLWLTVLRAVDRVRILPL